MQHRQVTEPSSRGQPEDSLQTRRGVGKNWRWHCAPQTRYSAAARSPHCSSLRVWLWFTAWHLYGPTRVIICNLETGSKPLQLCVQLFQPSVQVRQPLHLFVGASLATWEDVLTRHRCPVRLIWSQLCGSTLLHLNNVLAVSARRRNEFMSGMLARCRFDLAHKSSVFDGLGNV